MDFPEETGCSGPEDETEEDAEATCEGADDATNLPCDFFGNPTLGRPCNGASPHGFSCEDWHDLRNSLRRSCNLNCAIPCRVRYLEPAQYVCCTGGPGTRVRVGQYECPILTGTCGDGVTNRNEECDDGNNINNDYCNNNCQLVICGDDNVTPPEQCDDGDGNGAPPATCGNDCRLYVPGCGDGVLNPPGEQCDDGNTVAGDGCSGSCTTEVCGNGTVDHGEQCDLGAGNAPPPASACTPTCQAYSPRCGDGYLTAGEQCDDGNNVSGDGCSGICATEICGNGRIDWGEQCDDGNILGGDGCSATCTLETPPPPPPGEGGPMTGLIPGCTPPAVGASPPPMGPCIPPGCICDGIPQPWRGPAEVACNTIGTVFDPASLGGGIYALSEVAALAPAIMCRDLEIADLAGTAADAHHYECVCDRNQRFCNALCVCAWTVFRGGQTTGIFGIDFQYSFSEALTMCRSQGYSE